MGDTWLAKETAADTSFDQKGSMAVSPTTRYHIYFPGMRKLNHNAVYIAS